MSAGLGSTGVLTGGLVLTGWPPATPWRKGSGVEMVSERLVGLWEAAYREYGAVSDVLNESVPGDAAIAERMARASQAVAAVWREMAHEPELLWWNVAALRAAAQAFEYQSRDWTARARHSRESAAVDGARPPRPYPVAPRRGNRHGHGSAGGVADAI